MLRRVVPLLFAVAAVLPAAAQAQVVKPPATSPGGGPQRWNVVDGVQKLSVTGYQAKETLQPLPPVAAKPKGVARASTKRTRAVVEDAVFTPLNKRSETAKYRYLK
jgi:hypothetical protein